MKKSFMFAFAILFCFAYVINAAVVVSSGDEEKIYNNNARFAIDSDEDAFIKCDGVTIVVPKMQKILSRVEFNERGERIISISGSKFKNIKINGYNISSNEKCFFIINVVTGEITVLDGYLTVKDYNGNILFAAKNVPFFIDLKNPGNEQDKQDRLQTLVDNETKKQELRDLSPSAPRP